MHIHEARWKPRCDWQNQLQKMEKQKGGGGACRSMRAQVMRTCCIAISLVDHVDWSEFVMSNCGCTLCIHLWMALGLSHDLLSLVRNRSDVSYMLRRSYVPIQKSNLLQQENINWYAVHNTSNQQVLIQARNRLIGGKEYALRIIFCICTCVCDWYMYKSKQRSEVWSQRHSPILLW